MQRLQSISTLVSLTASFWVFQPLFTTAQILPDNSLGNESSIVVPNVNINGINSDRIDGGAIRGSNLFHSFQEFNIDNGRGAYFSNPENISNILSRVTGSNISNILGTLGVLGNANLFLINPNGIVFGQNARLDVGGSFFASTADGILFENGIEFAVSNPEAPPLLTINMPLGLNFRENPGSIINQSIAVDSEDNFVGLQVAPQKTLGFVGGDIQVEGGILTAPQGRIELGSVARNSLVSLTPIAQGYVLGYENVQNFQDIALSQEAFVDVRGEGGGDIQIQGRRVTLTDGSVIDADTQGSEPGGLLSIQASESVEIFGGGNVTASESIEVAGISEDGLRGSIISTQTQELGNADAGDLTIITGELIVLDGAQISAFTLGDGDAGELKIDTEHLTIQDGAQISTSTFGAGSGGTLTINTERLTAQNGSGITSTTSGSGQAGNINVVASELIEVSGEQDGHNSVITTQTQELNDGKAGNLTIQTENLILQNGGQITTSTFGSGNAGSLTVRANQIDLIGQSVDGMFPSALQSNVEELVSNGQLQEGVGASGNGGEVFIETQQLTISGGAGISASTRGSGNAGSLTIRAAEVEITGESSGVGSQVNSGATGQGGVVTIESGRLIVQDRGDISVGTLSTGQGGTLTINTGELIVQDGGSITARTEGSGQGGTINVNASELISVSGSGIFSDGRLSPSSLETTTFTSAKAGDLTIETRQLIIEDGGQIAASTSGSGDGGNLTVQASEIELIGTFDDGQQEAPSGLFVDVGPDATGRGGTLAVDTDHLILREGAQIDASTFGFGNGGELIIRANEIELIGRSASGRFPSGLFTGVNSGIEDFDMEATGDGGELKIEAERLTLKDGAEISVETSSIGNAGNLIIHANEIEVSGFAEGERFSAISARTTEGSQGDGGTLEINSEVVSVENQAEIIVSSQGEGVAGNLNINASSIFLDNQASLNGETTAGQGNITLNTDDLRLRNNSSITTNATGKAIGGNITINTETLTALENSDISANAEDAFGGRIIINADGILGAVFRDQQTRFSDITATSERGPEFSGTVELNTEIDPSSGLIELSQTVVDPADLIAQNFCKQGRDSQFIITGRGGLPPNPGDPQSVNLTRVGLIETVPSNSRPHSALRHQPTAIVREPYNPNDQEQITSDNIIPARGWIRDENGDVILVSYDPTKTGVRRQQYNPHPCQP